MVILPSVIKMYTYEQISRELKRNEKIMKAVDTIRIMVKEFGDELEIDPIIVNGYGMNGSHLLSENDYKKILEYYKNNGDIDMTKKNLNELFKPKVTLVSLQKEIELKDKLINELNNELNKIKNDDVIYKELDDLIKSIDELENIIIDKDNEIKKLKDGDIKNRSQIENLSILVEQNSPETVKKLEMSNKKLSEKIEENEELNKKLSKLEEKLVEETKWKNYYKKEYNELKLKRTDTDNIYEQAYYDFKAIINKANIDGEEIEEKLNELVEFYNFVSNHDVIKKRSFKTNTLKEKINECINSYIDNVELETKIGKINVTLESNGFSCMDDLINTLKKYKAQINEFDDRYKVLECNIKCYRQFLNKLTRLNEIGYEKNKGDGMLLSRLDRKYINVIKLFNTLENKKDFIDKFNNLNIKSYSVSNLQNYLDNMEVEINKINIKK